MLDPREDTPQLIYNDMLEEHVPLLESILNYINTKFNISLPRVRAETPQLAYTVPFTQIHIKPYDDDPYVMILDKDSTVIIRLPGNTTPFITVIKESDVPNITKLIEDLFDLEHFLLERSTAGIDNYRNELCHQWTTGDK